MRKHGGTPSRRDKHVTLAAISPPGVARGRFVGGHQSGLAGCKPPPLFKRGASPCLSERQRQREPWGAFPQPSAPTYLPTCVPARTFPVPTYGANRGVLEFYKKPLQMEADVRSLSIDNKKKYGQIRKYQQKRVDEVKRSLMANSPREPVTVSAWQSPGT